MELNVAQIVDSISRMQDRRVFPMNHVEYHRANFVNSLIDDCSTSIDEGSVILPGKGFVKSIDLLGIYPDSSFGKLVNPIPFRLIRTNDDSILAYNTVIDTPDDKDVYPVRRIEIPPTFHELSPYYIAHEYHHALKDVNPKEYRYMLRYADVIPLLFELVSGETDEIQKKLIQNRFALLKRSREFLEAHNNRIDTHYIWDAFDSKNCQYFNSFYYATILYALYQDNPKKVLRDATQVLRREETTYELLRRNRLLDKNFDSEVEKHIEYLKKYSS